MSATIVGQLYTSHVPAIGGAIARGRQHEPYWRPFFDAWGPVREWVAALRPDTVVMVYNDHGLNFFLDKMPTFAIGAAPAYGNADEGWGIPQVAPFAGDESLSWHLLEQLVAAEFDMVACQEMQVDHAFTLPMALLWPDQRWPVQVVPVCVNTVLFPLPSAARCWKLGQAIGHAVASFPEERRVLVIGSGGLSHQLEGERAGFINKAFDLRLLDSLPSDPRWATKLPINELVREAGTQGIELVNWLAARATVEGPLREVHRTYHVPISNTAAAVVALEP